MTNTTKKVLMICGLITLAGLILSTIGFLLGGVSDLSKLERKYPWIDLGGSSNMVSGAYNLKAFTDIRINCSDGSVDLVEGDDYHVEMTYDEDNGAPQVVVVDGTLVVSDWGRQWDKKIRFNIFGEGSREAKMKIYYPKGKKLKNVDLDCDMGTVTVSDSTIDQLKINVNTGTVTLKNIAAKTLDADVDMGTLEGQELRTDGSNLKLDTGNIEMDGAIKGKNRIICDMGEVNIRTSLPQDAYSIEADIDMGEVTIGNQTVNGNYVEKNNAVQNGLSLSCDTGSINVDFK